MPSLAHCKTWSLAQSIAGYTFVWKRFWCFCLSPLYSILMPALIKRVIKNSGPDSRRSKRRTREMAHRTYIRKMGIMSLEWKLPLIYSMIYGNGQNNDESAKGNHFKRLNISESLAYRYFEGTPIPFGKMYAGYDVHMRSVKCLFCLVIMSMASMSFRWHKTWLPTDKLAPTACHPPSNSHRHHSPSREGSGLALSNSMAGLLYGQDTLVLGTGSCLANCVSDICRQSGLACAGMVHKQCGLLDNDVSLPGLQG